MNCNCEYGLSFAEYHSALLRYSLTERILHVADKAVGEGHLFFLGVGARRGRAELGLVAAGEGFLHRVLAVAVEAFAVGPAGPRACLRQLMLVVTKA